MKNYQEIYRAAVEAYKGAVDGWEGEKAAAEIFNKLTKKELKELNDQLRLTLLYNHETKAKWIRDMAFFGIQWDLDRKAIAEIMAEVRKERKSLGY